MRWPSGVIEELCYAVIVIGSIAGLIGAFAPGASDVTMHFGSVATGLWLAAGWTWLRGEAGA